MAFLFDKLFEKGIDASKVDQSSYNDQRQIDNSKKSSKTITNTTTTTDARSLILTINSPNAVTKKSDKTVPSVSTDVTPTMNAGTDFGSPVNQPTASAETGASGSSGWIDLLIIGGLVGGGLIILGNATSGGKK